MQHGRVNTLTVLFFCSVSIPSGNAVEPPYRIGFVVSLTGPLAEFGDAIRNGVTLALEENPQLREKITPVYEDSKYDSKTSISVFHKLRSVDHVRLVYVFGGPMSDTLAPIAEQYRMPMFSTEYDERYTKGREYVFRFANNARAYAESLLSVLRSRKMNRFGIVKVENQFHNTLTEALFSHLGSGETAEVIYTAVPGDVDFRSAVRKLLDQEFDAIGVYLSPGMQNTFLRQLQTAGKHVPLFGTDSFESESENEGVHEASEGAIFSNGMVSKEFVRRYEERFQKSEQIVHAALAYEFINLAGGQLALGIRSSDQIVRAFQFRGTRKSVCGDYSFRNSPETGKYFDFPISVRVVRNGKASELTTSIP